MRSERNQVQVCVGSFQVPPCACLTSNHVPAVFVADFCYQTRHSLAASKLNLVVAHLGATVTLERHETPWDLRSGLISELPAIAYLLLCVPCVGVSTNS